ncbi:hypothetical protein LTR53_006859 [Teratosphaeriaceae sp. CCFEE 6253]|nr:hypothetical protein LTR53_006859 [Teratosphaeriaceae sp. CCFEE 6253]
MTSLSTTVYTPLEQLLLFQALRHEGTNESGTTNFSFTRISEQLNAIPLVRNDPAYDEGRLSADALRQLYLWLLKEEVKRDRQRQAGQDDSHANADGDASHATRKRKTPSPTLPTVQEAAQHSYLIPQLVTRLYARYREKAVTEIRDHESKYKALSRNAGEVGDGETNERLARAATLSPKPASNALSQDAAKRPEPQRPGQSDVAVAAPSQKAGGTPAEAPPKRYSQAKIDAVINHGPEPLNGYSAHRRTSSNTTLPPLSEMAPQSPHFGIPAKLPAHGAQNMPPYMHQQYTHSPPPNVHPSSYAPQHAHPPTNNQLHNALSRPSSSPRPILPPPPGMKLPHPSPVPHTASPKGSISQQHYQPQHRTSLGATPVGNQTPHAYPPQLPAPPGYYPTQPYQDRNAQYPQQYASAAPRYPAQALQPPRPGGYQLQPWPVDNSAQTRAPTKQQQSVPYAQSVRQQTQKQYQPMPAPLQRAPSYAQYSTTPAIAPRDPPQTRLISDIVSALATPPTAHRRPVWKSERRPQPLVLPNTPPAPETEPLSPVVTRAKSPSRPQRSARKRGADAASEAPATVPSDAKGCTRRARDRSPQSVKSSVAGDTVRTGTRSQSVSTVVGTMSAPEDRPGSRAKVKHEPSTPAEIIEAPEHLADTSATPASGPMTRKRRGTLQSHPQPSSKRARQRSPALAPDEHVEAAGTPPPRSTTVLATRNFNKVSSSIMDEISSHKHAAYFKNPVKDTHASGYSDIIKQPQNLKSIRAAIMAGTRAVAAAAASLDSPAVAATPTGKASAEGSTIELERTVDIVPPKAIVNAAQLEKEVYRMFANAVMFNPGEDGLVADTREMFRDVQGMMRQWRGVEGDAAVVEEEAMEEGKGKRRKV